MRAALVAAALASPFTDLAAAKAARRVWQGRLTEARLAADREVAAAAAREEAGEAEAKEHARLLLARYRLHTKATLARAVALENEAAQVTSTAKAVATAVPTSVLAPPPKLPTEAPVLPDESEATLSRAEANATAILAQRVTAESEVTALAAEEKLLRASLADVQAEVAKLRATRGPDAAKLNATLQTLERTAAAVADATPREPQGGPLLALNLTAANLSAPPASATAVSASSVEDEASAVDALEKRLFQLNQARASVEAETADHLREVESMNASFANLVARSQLLNSELSKLAPNRAA